MRIPYRDDWHINIGTTAPMARCLVLGVGLRHAGLSAAPGADRFPRERSQWKGEARAAGAVRRSRRLGAVGAGEPRPADAVGVNEEVVVAEDQVLV